MHRAVDTAGALLCPLTAFLVLRAALALLRLPALRRIALCALPLGLATGSDSFACLLLQRRTGCRNAG